MGINFVGELVDKPRIKAGYIGCGSHSRRNVLPALKFASEFGFKRAYGKYMRTVIPEINGHQIVVIE